MRGNHRGIFFLAAKAAAGFHLYDANAVFWEAKECGECLMNVIGALQRAPDRDTVIRIGACDHSLGLDVELFLRPGFVGALDDEIGGRPSGVHVSLLDLKRLEQVVAAPDGVFACERIIEGENSGKGLDFDAHSPPRFFKQILVPVGEENDGLFGMIDKLGGQTGLVVNQERDAIFPRDILGGDDREFAPGNVAFVMNPANAAARGRAANGHAVKHAGKRDIVHVAGPACNFLAALFAGNGFSDNAGLHPGQPQ